MNAEFRNDSDKIVTRAGGLYLSFDKPFEEQYTQIEQVLAHLICQYFRGNQGKTEHLYFR